MQVGYDFDGLEEMVEGYDGVEEHEEGLGHFEDVFHKSSSLGLEVLHAVVAYVTDCAPGQRW